MRLPCHRSLSLSQALLSHCANACAALSKSVSFIAHTLGVSMFLSQASFWREGKEKETRLLNLQGTKYRMKNIFVGARERKRTINNIQTIAISDGTSKQRIYT